MIFQPGIEVFFETDDEALLYGYIAQYYEENVVDDDFCMEDVLIKFTSFFVKEGFSEEEVKELLSILLEISWVKVLKTYAQIEEENEALEAELAEYEGLPFEEKLHQIIDKRLQEPQDK